MPLNKNRNACCKKDHKGLRGYCDSRFYGLSIAVIAMAAATVFTTAQAASFSADNGLALDLDTSVGYSAAWRMKNPDSTLLNGGKKSPNPVLAINGDDGNRSFAKGDLIQNSLTLGVDADLHYEDYGLFLRGRAYLDDVYGSGTGHDGAPSCNAASNGFDCSDVNKGADNYHASRAEIMDAFVYGAFDVGERSASLRVGEQVVSWGESLFMNGGISAAQSPLDVSKTNAPGVELKDIFLPVGQIYGEFDLSDSVSMGTYYQWDWKRARIDSPGTYFSPVDVVGEGVETVLLGLPPALGTTALPVERDEPDEGQWGTALRYTTQDGTEYGFHYLRYNDTLPALQANLAPVTLAGIDPALFAIGDLYQGRFSADRLTLEYFEDIDLVGASFGTVVGDTNVSGEITYRDGQPVQVAGPGFFFVPAETLQAQTSVFHIFGETSFADNLVLLGEVGYNRVLDHEDPQVNPAAEAALVGALTPSLGAAAAQATVDGLKAGGIDNDKSAWGYVIRLQMDYFSVAPGLDLTTKFTWRNDVNGVSAIPFTFAEDVQSLGIGLDFTYLAKYQFGLNYVKYLTDTDDLDVVEFDHMLSDRDSIGIYFKTTF